MARVGELVELRSVTASQNRGSDMAVSTEAELKTNEAAANTTEIADKTVIIGLQENPSNAVFENVEERDEIDNYGGADSLLDDCTMYITALCVVTFVVGMLVGIGYMFRKIKNIIFLTRFH
jgi:hypothetical protein